MSRKKRLAMNSLSSFLHQIIVLLCGFIVPKLILSKFGSEVNGLVGSIAQFLSIIAFLELGVGAVVQSSLYKPIADNDNIAISRIMASANKFFEKIAIVLIVYVLFLIIFYPLIVNSAYDHFYTAILIVSISINSFAQYYFGVVDRLLLNADQRGYIQYNLQSIALILNTIACAILIKIGASIQVVKMTTSLIYLLIPFVLRVYVNKKYKIDRKIKYEVEPITQKWNGIAQHIAAVVLNQTDTIVLTIFSTLSNVSIYGVYFLVVNGVKNFCVSLTNGVQALLGELWAKQEIGELNKIFCMAEWAIHTGGVFIFGCTASLIVPFIRVYTYGIEDANYIVPDFALLITLAIGMSCIRLPYNIMILAAGHYKQTQTNYIVAAGINILISILTVKAWGLIGVAIGTLAALVYQTIWMVVYDYRVFLRLTIWRFLKQVLVDAAIFAIAFPVSKLLHMRTVSYFSWVFLAIKCCCIWAIVVIVCNALLYKNNAVYVYKKFLYRISLLKKRDSKN